MNKEVCSLRPSVDYLNLVLDGLREHGYDESTIKKVEAIAARTSILQPLIPRKLAMGPSNDTEGLPFWLKERRHNRNYRSDSKSGRNEEGFRNRRGVHQDPNLIFLISDLYRAKRWICDNTNHQLILKGHYILSQSAKAMAGHHNCRSLPNLPGKEKKKSHEPGYRCWNGRMVSEWIRHAQIFWMSLKRLTEGTCVDR